VKDGLYDDDDRTRDMTLFYDARLIALEAFDTHGVLHVAPGGDSSRVAFRLACTVALGSLQVYRSIYQMVFAVSACSVLLKRWYLCMEE
jgi:hypothetical protein